MLQRCGFYKITSEFLGFFLHKCSTYKIYSSVLASPRSSRTDKDLLQLDCQHLSDFLNIQFHKRSKNGNFEMYRVISESNKVRISVDSKKQMLQKGNLTTLCQIGKPEFKILMNSWYPHVIPTVACEEMSMLIFDICYFK